MDFDLARELRTTRGIGLDLGLVEGMRQAGHALGYRQANGPTGELSPLIARAPALSAGAVV